MKRHTTITYIATLVLATFACALPQVAQAQSLGDLLKDRIKRTMTEEVENKADQATRKVVRCALGDEQCIRAAKKKGAKVETYEPEQTTVDDVVPNTDALPSSETPPSSETAGATPAPAATPTVHALPADIKPVPSGPAVPLAKMQASCDVNAVGRTKAARKDPAFNLGLPGAAAVLAKIKPVFASFAPNGFETEASVSQPVDVTALQPAYMRPWVYAVGSQPYGCHSNGKFFKDTHYGFHAFINVNYSMGEGPFALPHDFDPNSENGDGTSQDARLGFYRLRGDWLGNGLPQAANGFFHIEGHTPGEYTDTYWFTRGGQVPFAYVTRREFLRKQIDILQIGLADESRKLERSYTAAGLQPNRAKIDQMLDYGYRKPIANYQKLLKQPVSWLQQKAILSPSASAADASYEILDESKVDSRVLVPIKPDPNYLDDSKAPGEPQYIVIYMKNSHRRGEYYQLRDLIEQNAEVFKALVK